MRTLNFLVEGQRLRADPSCDFSGIVPGTSNYLFAEFSFSKEWTGTVKVAEFKKRRGLKPASVPIVNGRCEIPSEVLTGSKFFINVIGKNGSYKITTNESLIKQEG